MIKKIKNNLFTVIIILAYITLLIFNKPLAITSLKNSGYYIKEMLIIMPIIFVLTALLDTWINKETIMKFLGKESKIKGSLLAFVLGSVSAGPIYAAFPICVMLHKKGASIKNIVIILSTWAVVKVPMLINEVKFLGFHFMIIRWVLTLIAIFVFASIMNSFIKDEDLLVDEAYYDGKVNINIRACIGCGICKAKYPELFEIDGKKAHIKDIEDKDIDNAKLQNAIKNCPVKAIKE